MYKYDELDRTLLRQRVVEFSDQVTRYVDGQLEEEEFKQLRLRNGLYVQRHAPMLRIAIPYGLLSSRQLRMLAHVARTYDRGYGHFTTRQNFQLNWPALEQVPALLGELAEVDLHAIQTSGNVVRNITADPLAGVASDEIEDPRPYCELLRQWSLLHPEFNWLPRKFKIAVAGGREDRALLQAHDVGLQIVEHENTGEHGFRVYVGGGLGRTPILGKVVREFLPVRHLLSYVEAILRVYNLEGRRDNLHKARIKILVNALGIERFRERVEAEWPRVEHRGLALSDSEVQAVRAHFAPPAYDASATDADLGAQLEDNAAFQRWYQHNTLPHRVSGYRIVTLSLKALGAAPGDLDSDRLVAVADLAERYSFGQIRSTKEQNLIFADVAERALYTLWRSLDALGLATPNIGAVQDMIVCPGLDFCSLANARTLNVSSDIQARITRLDQRHDLGEVHLNISGCMNGCAHHSVGHIGILGVDKHGEEWYQITLGGDTGNSAALGKRLGPAVEQARVAEVVETLLEVYLESRRDGERFIDTYNRIGIRPFKERVYADHQKSRDRRGSLAA